MFILQDFWGLQLPPKQLSGSGLTQLSNFSGAPHPKIVQLSGLSHEVRESGDF